MDLTVEHLGSEELYDLDLSFLDDLPPLEELPLDVLDIAQQNDTLQLQSGEDDFQIETWAEQLDTQVTAEPDYTAFESWIPDFRRPAKPCDYCRSKQLNCYFRKGQTDCTPCKSLFRECSLNSTTMEATNYAFNTRGTFFDALHSVSEDVCIEQGSRTTAKFLKSKHGELIQEDDPPGSSRRNGIRFPQAAVKILRGWYHNHQDHPYPNEEEKATLEESTGLKPHQLANWLANQRRKSKVMAKSRPRRCISPSACPRRPLTPAIDIVGVEKPWEDLNPFERWKHSPPENEPAAFDDIANAVASSDLADGASTPSNLSANHLKGSSNESLASGRRAASTTSAETSQASSLSASSSAAYSNNSSHGSFGSFSSSLAGKRDRRRRKRSVPLRQATEEKKRTFQCTFCTDTFRSKYDWTRHEKSLHLSLERYICAPLGPYIVDTASGNKMCVYCGLQDPQEGHEDKHNHRACEEKGLDSRTFFRKDHLRQHLRLMHGWQLTPSMDAWKFTTTNISSRCGFCAQRFTLWQDRVDHLTGHFRAGTRMIDWKGCRGLDPAIAAIVTNAMPPYLIGIESLSPDPFSATNEASMREFADPLGPDTMCEAEQPGVKQRSPDDLPPKATCWEILTIRLGQYANEMIAKAVVLTDEMLQTQARRILYDSDDSWNQTAADNPEWLDLFKKGHGLDLIPSRVGGQGQKVPEDLEWYSDLGVRIPFFVQLEQYNKMQNEEALKNGTGGRARKETETSSMMRNLYQQLTTDGILHNSLVRCPHPGCSKNMVECHFMDGDQLRRRQNRWCDQALTPSNAGRLAKFVGLAKSGISIAPLEDEQVNAEADARRAAKARASCLEHLQWGEVECCPFREQIDVLGDRRDAFFVRQAQHAASRKSSPRQDQANDCSTNDSTESFGYFPYHRAELPADRARQFATITGPWKDSGLMPQAITTAEQPMINAEAIMELLGPVSKQHAPTTTASLHTLPAAEVVDGYTVMDYFDQLPLDFEEIHTAARTDDDCTVPRKSSGREHNLELAGRDVALDDFVLDDMNFDEVFDLNLDDEMS